MREPYYQDKWVTIYHGDCREILPELPKVDLVLTDPPYLEGDFSYFLPQILSITDNLVVTPGKLCSFDWIRNTKPVYEYAWESRSLSRGGSACLHISFEPILVYRMPIKPLGSDILRYPISNQGVNHPWPKPQDLISKLIVHWSKEGELVLDLFLGSGTTCYCAKKLLRKSIGIEIEEKYCEIAAKRCSQMVMEFAE